MPSSAFLTGAALLWLGLLLIPLATAWSRSADLAHGWAAALLMGSLWWERLPRLASGPASESGVGVTTWRRRGTPGMALAAAAALASLGAGTRLFLEPFPLWPGALLLHCGIFFALGSLCAWHVGGAGLARWLLAPGVVLAGALPWPGVVDRGILQPLREGLAALAAEILTLTASPSIAEGTSVRLAGGWVGVDEACGGIRSLQAAVMLSLFFGEFSRHSFTRRAVLVGIAIVAALAGNLARILFLAAAAAAGGPDRVSAVHDTAGWIALGLTLCGVGLSAWLLRPLDATRPASLPVPAPALPARLASRTGAGLCLLVVPLALLAAGEAGTRLWFEAGDARHAEMPGWTMRLPASRPDFRAEPLGDAAREMLQPDRYEAGLWRDAAGERVGAYTIEWHRGQLARTLPFLHNPTICLPLAGCELREALPVQVVRVGTLDVPFYRYRFSRAGEEFLVCFVVWDPTRGAPLRQPGDTSGFGSWFATRWTEVAERRRHQPAQLACIVVHGPSPENRFQYLVEGLLLVAQ